jgi:hypothetical protein
MGAPEMSANPNGMALDFSYLILMKRESIVEKVNV